MPTAEEQLRTEWNASLKDLGDALHTKNADELKKQLDAHEKKTNDMIAASIAASKEEVLKESARLINQRTARGIGGPLGTENELLTIGQRFAATDEFKALAANPTGRFRASLNIKGRLSGRELKAANTITEPGSGIILYPQRMGIFAAPLPPLVMRDLFTTVPLSIGNAVEYMTETWNYAADYQILEGDRKAQGDVAYVDKTAVVRTIAWFVKVSKQMLADVPYFASTVDTRLLWGIAKKEDHELLWGDGTAGHLLGLMPQATALPVGTIPGVDNTIDQVMAALAYLTSQFYTPTAIVMNPLDWAAMQIMKTPTGVYILGGPPTSIAEPRLWGLPAVLTPSMTLGQFLIGSFPANATLFDREAASVEISFENEDDFVRNLATIRAEERITLAVYRPQAFVKSTLAGPYLATEGAGREGVGIGHGPQAGRKP